jgi:TATA-binding protein-associated factor Taf7
MTFNTPLPISGRDPDSVPFEERIAELEEAKRDPMKAIRATRERRNREQLERGREDLKEAWLASGATEQEFEQNWPELRKEQIKRRAEEAEAQAHSESFRQMTRNF